MQIKFSIFKKSLGKSLSCSRTKFHVLVGIKVQFKTLLSQNQRVYMKITLLFRAACSDSYEIFSIDKKTCYLNIKFKQLCINNHLYKIVHNLRKQIQSGRLSLKPFSPQASKQQHQSTRFLRADS